MEEKTPPHPQAENFCAQQINFSDLIDWTAHHSKIKCFEYYQKINMALPTDMAEYWLKCYCDMLRQTVEETNLKKNHEDRSSNICLSS